MLKRFWHNKILLFPLALGLSLAGVLLMGNVARAALAGQTCSDGTTNGTGTCYATSCNTGTSITVTPQTDGGTACDALLYCCTEQPTPTLGPVLDACGMQSGVCQASDCGANKITGTDLCTDTTKPICCKPQSSTTTYDYCATVPADQTGKKAYPGGVCKGQATDCTSSSPKLADVSSLVSTNECASTTDTKICCGTPAAADQTTPPNPGTVSPPPGDEAGKFAKVFSYLLATLTAFIGTLLLFVFERIVDASKFPYYINSQYVQTGWIVLRDLVNMFFVLGLLFIAFVTVLKIERYQWQKLLPKLLIMAVVVNFSRTICGLIIDFFQVIMFTFVNAYRDILGGNLFNGFGLNGMWDSITKQGDANSSLNLIMINLLGLVYVTVAFVVCIIFLIILIFRIIMLWILVVFSPLAFFSASFNGISGKIATYWGRWFNMFIEYCMVGPLLAFFLWLSILMIADPYATQYSQDLSRVSPSDSANSGAAQLQKELDRGVANSQAGKAENVMKYILGILMLVAGLKFTSEMKVMGASYAGKAAGKMQDLTLGTAERLARGAGKVATGAAALPLAPFKPIVGGVYEGVKQRLERSTYGRILTKKGREQMREAARERTKSFIPGIGGLGVRDMRAKQAKDYKDSRKDINWDNPDSIRNAMYEYDDNGEVKKDANGNKVFKNTDKRFLEAAYTALADNGKLKYDDVDDMDKTGLAKGWGSQERQVYLEDMEKRYEKKTHIKKAFSNLIYNAESNEYEDVNGLEKRGAEAKNKAEALDNPVNLRNIDFDKIRKKDDNGIFTLKVDAQEFKDLTPGQQEHLKYLQTQGQGKDSDFYALMRSTEIRNKKYNEIRKSTSTATRSDLNEAGKQANLGDIVQNPADYALAEVDGFTDQISRVGELDKVARDNINVKSKFMMGTNEERAALIKANENLFDKSLHGKSADELSNLDSIKKIDAMVAGMSEDKLDKFQNLIKESGGEFNAIGQKQVEGEALASLAEKIRQKRADQGIGKGIENEVKGKLPKGYPVAGTRDSVSFVNKEAGSMLAATEDLSGDQREDAISQRIMKNTDLMVDDARDLAKYLLANQSKIKTREKKIKETMDEATKKVRKILDEAKRQQRTSQDSDRVEFAINALSNQLGNEISQGALPADSIQSEALRSELLKLKDSILFKDDAKRTAANKFNEAVTNFTKAAEALGYKIAQDKKKERAAT